MTRNIRVNTFCPLFQYLSIYLSNSFHSRLTVRDSSGDGIGETAYTLSLGDEVLLREFFVSGGTISSQYATEPPTAAPSATPNNDSDTAPLSSTSAPTEENPKSNTDRDTPSAAISYYHGLCFSGFLGCAALSALISAWLLQR